jgi:drug/metabolite transporter (DMT)-like permease
MLFRSEKVAGMAAMLTGVASFALMDAGLKVLAENYPTMQAAALRGLVALPLVFAWAMVSGGLRQLVQVRWPLHLIRGLLSIAMMATFVYALNRLSLGKSYALFFVAPVLIVLLSILMLGERVRRSQWVAIAIGLGGVLLVALPGSSAIGWLGKLAVIGTALCYAFSSVLVRIIGRTDSTQSMVFWMTCMMAIGSTLLALADWRPVEERHYLLLAGVAVTGAIGQWGITYAFKHAKAATVAPLEYTGLAWAVIIDLLVWSAAPEWSTLAGAAVLIASGVYLLRSEARSA